MWHIPVELISEISHANLPSIRGALQLLKILQCLWTDSTINAEQGPKKHSTRYDLSDNFGQQQHRMAASFKSKWKACDVFLCMEMVSIYNNYTIYWNGTTVNYIGAEFNSKRSNQSFVPLQPPQVSLAQANLVMLWFAMPCTYTMATHGSSQTAVVAVCDATVSGYTSCQSKSNWPSTQAISLQLSCI